MKCKNPIIQFLPVVRVDHFFIQIRNNLGHRLMITTEIARNLQMDATGQMNRFFRAVHHVGLYEYGREFRVGHTENERSR